MFKQHIDHYRVPTPSQYDNEIGKLARRVGSILDNISYEEEEMVAVDGFLVPVSEKESEREIGKEE